MGCRDCNETCTCLVVAGTGTTVSGTGKPADPFVISADGGTFVAGVDTPTVDTTVTGTGTVGDPYLVSSEVLLSGDADQCLSIGTDGALYVACPDGSETIVTAGTNVTITGTGTTTDPYVITSSDLTAQLNVLDTPCIDLTVTGTGLPGDPFVLSASPIIDAEPNGLTCGPGGLVVSPSTDAGNELTIGTDGNLFVPTGVDATTVSDTPTVNLTETGNDITADVVISPDANNCLTAHANGLYTPCPDGSETIVDPGTNVTVTGTGTATDPYVINSTGGGGESTTVADTNSVDLTLTGNQITADVKVGCGLEVTADGVIANVQTWPYVCDLTDKASGVYCDPATGELRGAPRDLYTTLNTSDSTGNVNLNLAPGATRCVTTTQTINLTDECEDVKILYTLVTFHDTVIPAGTNWRTFFTTQIDGGPVITSNAEQSLNDTAHNEQDRRTAFSGTAPSFTAGAIHTVSVQFCIENLEPVGGNTISSRRIDVSLNVLYNTRNPA